VSAVSCRVRATPRVSGTKRDLKSTLGIIIAPEVVAMQRYERALPQYTLGYEHRVRRIEAESAKIPGCFSQATTCVASRSEHACVRPKKRPEQVTAYLEKNSTLPRGRSAS